MNKISNLKEQQRIWTCKKCSYETLKKNNYMRHLKSIKHKEESINENMIVNKDMNEVVNENMNQYINQDRTTNNTIQKRQNKTEKTIARFECECGKIYKYSSGLYRHKKKCNYKIITNTNTNNNRENINSNNDSNKTGTNNIDIENINIDDIDNYKDLTEMNKEDCRIINEEFLTDKEIKDIDYKRLILKLMTQNQKILETTVEMAKKPQIINNTQFNIMNYLNTECKDAINFSDFIEQIKYSFDELMMLPQDGWEKNVTNTFISQLQNLDVSKRPIHCSDKKRKTFYIKDDDEWKRDIERVALENGLRLFHNKQCNTYFNWKLKNKNKLDVSDNLYDVSMRMNIELCVPHKENGDKMKNRIINELTYLTIKHKKI